MLLSGSRLSRDTGLHRGLSYTIDELSDRSKIVNMYVNSIVSTSIKLSISNLLEGLAPYCPY